MLKIIHILIFIKRITKKILNLKLVTILKYRNTKTFFAKGYTPKLSEEVCICDYKSQKHCSVDICFSYFNSEEIAGMFYEKELQKENQTESRIDKVIKKKGDKLHVIWKGYDNSFQ